MENIAENIEKLYEKAERYSKTTYELVRLNTIDKTSDIISSLAIVITILIIAAIFTLFINIGIALWIGQALNSNALGFFIVSGFYIIVGIIVFIKRNELIKIPLDNLIVSKLLKSKMDDNNSETKN
ncbi:hypothetical protein [Flavobacterium capsici]|uniref:Phage holin family protein n=1 Tax=Flavobacterium capsici TaxID=3075618 RepID=A0AA96EU97_9FLAO|nr:MULTISPECIES: hypothetical protein [unclassified Flavobacterium]WNM18366.1 hypothetical protein RN608_10100 [Flavobacterium sp. PMR2A8]WNM22417.1 hypothetical protein RN605_03400 [Flavobacterium sp. PMTSA4]